MNNVTNNDLEQRLIDLEQLLLNLSKRVTCIYDLLTKKPTPKRNTYAELETLLGPPPWSRGRLLSALSPDMLPEDLNPVFFTP